MPFLGSQPAETALSSDDIADNAITEAKMANDAIGLTELKAGTDGEIISWDASGNPVAIGAGTSGHFLKSQGACSQPVFAAAGGAWNIIGTVVASNDATIAITGLDSTYDTYAIGLSDIVAIEDEAQAWLRLGDSSGVDSGASDYSWAAGSINMHNGTIVNGFSADDVDAQIKLMGSANPATGKDAGEGVGGMVYLHRPGDGTSWPMVTGTVIINQSNQYNVMCHMGGSRRSVITLDRVQFSFHSGNVATGRMTVWGIAHA